VCCILIRLDSVRAGFSCRFSWVGVLLLSVGRKHLVFLSVVLGCGGIILVGWWGNFIGVNFM